VAARQPRPAAGSKPKRSFAALGIAGGGAEKPGVHTPTLFHRLQDYSLRVSWKSELKPQLEDIFDGVVYRPVLERIAAIHQETLRSRLFVALHMHAGDGNVHTNIPGQLRRLRDAAGAYAVVEAHHGARASARRRGLRRARHRHYQARVPERGGDPAVSRLQGQGRPGRDASTRASCCPAPI
jgi:FAD/FMN-containing dehydrogenase